MSEIEYVTQWFDAKVTPERNGVYEIQDTTFGERCFSYFENGIFYPARWVDNPFPIEKAIKSAEVAKSFGRQTYWVKECKWRGVAK